MSDLAKHFHERFDVLTEATDDVRDQAFQLRYQVYCLETGFENCKAFPDRRESDAFDTHSAHGVIRDRRSGASMATVRLVMADAQGRFPLEHAYPDLFAQHGITEEMLPRASSGEISRFAVSKQLQERVAREPVARAVSQVAGTDPRLDTRVRDRPGGARNRRPLLTFGLFLALVRLSAMNNITHWVAIMEPSLLRLLARFGIRFTPIGEPVEYHGLRQPCFGRVDEVLTGIRIAQFDLWLLIADQELFEVAQVAGATRMEPAGRREQPHPMALDAALTRLTADRRAAAH